VRLACGGQRPRDVPVTGPDEAGDLDEDLAGEVTVLRCLEPQLPDLLQLGGRFRCLRWRWGEPDGTACASGERGVPGPEPSAARVAFRYPGVQCLVEHAGHLQRGAVAGVAGATRSGSLERGELGDGLSCSCRDFRGHLPAATRPAFQDAERHLDRFGLRRGTAGLHDALTNLLYIIRELPPFMLPESGTGGTAPRARCSFQRSGLRAQLHRSGVVRVCAATPAERKTLHIIAAMHRQVSELDRRLRNRRRKLVAVAYVGERDVRLPVLVLAR